MSKELNILQAIEMPVGTEFNIIFQDDNTAERVYLEDTIDGKGKIFKWCNCNDSECEQPYVASGFVNAKFIPIQKPVSFMEAVKQADSQRFKIIHPNYNDDCYHSLIIHMTIFESYSNKEVKDIILNAECYFEE